MKGASGKWKPTITIQTYEERLSERLYAKSSKKNSTVEPPLEFQSNHITSAAPTHSKNNEQIHHPCNPSEKTNVKNKLDTVVGQQQQMNGSKQIPSKTDLLKLEINNSKRINNKFQGTTTAVVHKEKHNMKTTNELNGSKHVNGSTSVNDSKSVNSLVKQNHVNGSNAAQQNTFALFKPLGNNQVTGDGWRRSEDISSAANGKQSNQRITFAGVQELGGSHSPPYCPTPDYDSDSSPPPNQSNSSHAVKNSILKFEKNIKKTVTFGENSTKEITPIKKNDFASSKSSIMMSSSHKSSHDVVEMQSIESFELTEPKISRPKPPPTYFSQPSKKDNKVSIRFCEYPGQNFRKEPNKFDFLDPRQQNGTIQEYEFDTELATTLSKSNLKSKSDCYMNSIMN